MDPHTMQSTDAEPGDTSSHRPVGVHTVSMSAIDSTMALGFHCASPEELDELVSQVLCFMYAWLEKLLLGPFSKSFRQCKDATIRVFHFGCLGRIKCHALVCVLANSEWAVSGP